MSPRSAQRAVAAVVSALAAGSLVAGCGTGPAAAPGPAVRTAGRAAAGPPSTASPGGRATPSPLRRSVPVRLEIPAIGVDTPVMRLGLSPDRTVRVPPIEAHAPAGWYEGSPTPGQVGPSVILGHVTVGRFGDGVFLRLARLKRGDHVVARLRDGASAVFTVESVSTVAKAHFPTASVYGDVDRPELRLITCGGPRDAGTGYLDNVVVRAYLSSAKP